MAQRIDPVTPEHVVPATRRRVLGIVGTVVAATIALNVALLVFLTRHPVNRGHWLLRSKWELLARAPAVDTVILGDSSCNQGVRPDVLAAQLGGTVLNLCTIGDMMAVNDAWMLETYLRRHTPKRVIVVHTDDMWDRDAGDRFVMLLGKIPRPWGFWDDLKLPLALGLGDKALIAAGRWAPLYADERSLKDLLTQPGKALARKYKLSPEGYMKLTRAAPANVRRDAVNRAETLDAPGRPNPINARALSGMAQLAAEHHVDLVFAPAPMFEGLYRDPRMVARLAEIERWIRANVGARARVIPGPPATFAAERMENVDHVIDEAATEYTTWLGRAVLTGQ
jgi:hypothetical protein